MPNWWGYRKPIATLAELYSRCTVSETGCILYPKTAHRYGIVVTIHGRDSVHRAAWKLSGRTIPDGLNVLHKCDVTHCCNVDHLFPGTQKQNMEDKVAKGRHRTGSRMLTSEEVMDMHGMRFQGFKVQQIADKFGISYGSAQYILTGVRHNAEFEAFCNSLSSSPIVLSRPHPTQPLATR